MVNEPFTSTLPLQGSGAPSEPAALARGTSVGRYIVLECIGRGGMGVVYRAYDPDLDRAIAIKLVRADGRNPDHRQRLRARLVREAQALARLSHANVVAVHDVGSFDDGVFVAIELVDGLTLGKVLADGPPPLARVLALFDGAGRGLAAAHAVGIVHRDFKPDNVIVARDGTARVLDFGLARAAREEDDTADTAETLEQPSPSSDAVTQAGAVMGTPGYMSPEQLDGRDVDARSDQFSFCVAMFEALFGVRPGADPVVPARTLAGERVEPRLRAALRRGLAAERATRFATMRGLLDDLAPRRRRRRIWIAAGVAAVAATAVVTVFATRPAAQPPCEGAEAKLVGVWDPARKAALRATFHRYDDDIGAETVERVLDRYAGALVAMHTESCRATQVLGEQSPELLDLRTECLDHRLAELHALTDLLVAADAATARRAVAGVHGLAPIEDCANTTALRDPLPPRNPVLSRMLRDQMPIARAEFLLGKFDDVDMRWRDLVAGAQLAGDRALEARSLYLGARTMRELGHPADAEEQLYRAIAIGEAARATDLIADCWLALAWLVGEDHGRPVEGLRFAAVARGVHERAGGNTVFEATLEDYVGVLELGRGNLPEARKRLERALALDEQLYGKDSGYAATLQHLGLLEKAAGNAGKALAMLHEARQYAEAELGPRHPDVLAMLGTEGATLYALDRYREAEQLLAQGVTLAEDSLGRDSEMVASLLTNLGLAHWKLKRYPEAKAALTRGRAIAEQRDPEGMRAATLDLDLALVLLDMGDVAGARDHAAAAVTGFEHKSDDLDVAQSLDVLATADLRGGHPADAVGALERALAARLRAKASLDDVAWNRFDLAKAILTATRDGARARALAETARAELERARDTDGVREVAAWLAARN